MVQTGPNNQMGGLNDGLFSVAYHSGTACAVNKPAMVPEASGNARDTSSLGICDLVIVIDSALNLLFIIQESIKNHQTRLVCWQTGLSVDEQAFTFFNPG